MDLKNKTRIIVYMVFIFIFLLRLIKITNPPLDYSSWRQSDTDSIARNFVEYNFNILYPQLNYDGPMPNYVQLELQITTFIIAIFYKLFGYKIVLARAVPIFFFMGSCFYLYLIVKRKSGIKDAVFTIIIYSILPINIIYSRNIMPESSMMFFMLGAMYYFILWIDQEKIVYYLLSLLFTTLTALTKLPSAMIGIAFVYLSFYKYRWKAFKNILLYIFPLIVFGITFLYFKWLGTIAEQKFVSGIGANLILPNFLSSIFKKDALSYLIQQYISKIFTVPGIILFVIGLIIKKEKKEYFYYAWLTAAIIHVIFIDSVIHLDYYLMFITPIISIFMGSALVLAFSEKKLHSFIYVSFIIIILQDGVFMKEALKVQKQYIEIGKYTSLYTDKNDLIIIDKDSPELLYTCDRKGWRLYGDMITPLNIKNLADKGAKYFVPSQKNIEGELKDYLDANYKRIEFPNGYAIYQLRYNNISKR